MADGQQKKVSICIVLERHGDDLFRPVSYLFIKGQGNVSERMSNARMAQPLLETIVNWSSRIVCVARVLICIVTDTRRRGSRFVNRVPLERIVAEKLIANHGCSLRERARITGASNIPTLVVHLRLKIAALVHARLRPCQHRHRRLHRKRLRGRVVDDIHSTRQ